MTLIFIDWLVCTYSCHRCPDQSSTTKCLLFGEKIVKIGPVDHEIIDPIVIFIKEEIMEVKHTALFASLMSRLNY